MSDPPFHLLETMRWEGGVALLDRHLDRLAASAAHLGFAYREREIRAALEHATDGCDGPHRVRLLLDPEGSVGVTATPMGPDDRMRSAVVFPHAVSAGGVFWRHKTTHRPHYEEPYRRAAAAGFDEAILVDGDGRVVEGTRTTVWVEREGRLLTPPRSVGGLPGVHRAHLLATRGDVREAVLSVADLRTADAVYLGNAVRGLQRVSVVTAKLPL
ncbi:MAG: aminotransferase class IV [Rubricoccaceae bacterium]|nr:aminotransferase class IV [Rubricoccaceae bacterium]